MGKLCLIISSRVCGRRVCTCCGSETTLYSVGVNEIPHTHLLSSSNSDRTEHDCEWILIDPEL